MKTFLTLLISILFLGKTYSQVSEVGVTTTDDLKMKAYASDTAARALVLKEYGHTQIINNEGPVLMMSYKVRIKIFNKKGFDKGDIVIPVYKGNSNTKDEEVYEIKAFTTNLDENGFLVKTELEEKNIYKENKNKYWDLVKFAMPNLREGCVIEYSYMFRSPHIFNFKEWKFQDDIPKLSSTYVASIPAIYDYNLTLIGHLKLTETNSEIVRECFNYGAGVKQSCSKMTYGMVNIPAFIIEDYMTAPSNFISAINFELSEYYDFGGNKHSLTKGWKDIDEMLKKEESFGGQLRKKSPFQDQIKMLTHGQDDELTKAKLIYNYVQKWYKHNGLRGIYAENIKKAYENRVGSVPEINLSLITALTYAGISSDPVLLSTRNNGFVNKIHPIISNFNYVIAKVNIGEKTYLLDATDPLLPFGLLPMQCINDQGRLMSFNKPSEWIDLKASQKASKTYSINLILEETGKIKGKISTYLGGYAAYDKREAIKKFNSIEEYVENLDESLPKFKIVKSEINNIDSLDALLNENYEIEIDAYENLNDEKFMYNPFIFSKVSENPFKLDERNYPIDWGAPSENRMMLSLTFPVKFGLISSPQAMDIGLPNNSGVFRITNSVDANTLTFSQVTQFAKSIYGPDEYPYLKALYSKIVEANKSDFIFQRK